MDDYDCIVIGAGSVGCPTTYFLAEKGVKVLCLDKRPSAGQGENKAAIGGVRATHSDPAKIEICKQSLDIYSSWKEKTGNEIDWKEGGYCFPVFREEDEETLRSILPIQKEHGLDIDWYGEEKIKEVVPGIHEEGLRGGTYSPNDGQVSPLKAMESFTDEAERLGAEFRYNEKVVDLQEEDGRIEEVKTEKGTYRARSVVNTAGADATKISEMVGVDTPVVPDSHEAGITAPVRPFLDPLVVDLRPGKMGKTENFYFGQVKTGQIIFCYTPKEKFVGRNRYSTSEFVPVVSKRLVNLIPRFKNLIIRRVWRGLYPMTPDGIPIVGKAPGVENFYLGVGMCGQGSMMGPGVGKNLANIISRERPLIDDEVLSNLSPKRDFYKDEEKLK